MHDEAFIRQNVSHEIFVNEMAETLEEVRIVYDPIAEGKQGIAYRFVISTDIVVWCILLPTGWAHAYMRQYALRFHALQYLTGPYTGYPGIHFPLQSSRIGYVAPPTINE
jgi:hypothetical protein